MHCPRCETVVLEEIDRSGVTVDRCSGCRGVWLDRGELEKIIARATAELEGTSGGRPVEAPPPRGAPHPRDPHRHHDYDPPSSRPGHHKPYKHKSFWHELFD